MAAEPPQRIFFGSLENTVAAQTPDAATPMEGVTKTSVRGETMELSEKTLEEQRKFEKLLKEREMQRAMREIAVPTQDAVVKQRLIELGEPIILFGEGKPERRERLRKICAERGVSPMPEKMRKAQADAGIEQQLEPIVSMGPKELKALRLMLTPLSLKNAKNRLIEREQRAKDLEENWDAHAKGFDSMNARIAKYTEVASQVGDVRPLQSIAFSPDGSEVATASWSGVVKIWTTKGASLVQTIKAHPERAQCVAWNPHRNLSTPFSLASCGADNDIKFWSPESTTTPLRVLKGHTDRVNKVAFHPLLPLLGSTSFDKTWTLWDIETGQELLAQGGNSRAVYGLSFHCDGALVATSGLDAIGRVWDLRSGQVIWTMRGHAKEVVSIDFAPNGYELATASYDQSVRIWDLRKKRTLYIMPAHTAPVSSVQYQPKYGNFILTSGYDNTLKVWSTKNWGLVKVFGGHQSKVSSVAMSPELAADEGHGDPYRPPLRFASASFDKTWKLWEYDPLADI